MREKFYKGYKKGSVKVEQHNKSEEVFDFKGEKYTQNQNQIDIFDKQGDKFSCIVEGNVLLLEGAVERKVEATFHYYHNFFAVCVKGEEYDKVMGLLEEESYRTHLYTYKGIHMGSQDGFWTNNPAMVDSCSIKADFLNRGREEAQQEGMKKQVQDEGRENF